MLSKLSLASKILLTAGILSITCHVTAQATDTLRVLSYNVLYLGDVPACQGPHNVMEGYIESVVSYANPDIAGFVKMEPVPMYTGDNSGSAPAGFQDSILQYIFNAAYPGRYAVCSFTNTSGADNMSMLFYNQQKLGFASMLCSYSNITDFDTWKLYYKSPDLATTHDTIFLYVTLNHTNSGSGSSDAATREEQISGEMSQIESHFSGTLPYMINMGDFNTHTSTEACYQTLVAPSNPAYAYYDPPFYPDATYSYPADWDASPSTYAPCLTVSTRETTSPNSCSTDVDGAKSWYDHIFLSASIVNAGGHIGYIPHSFKVIGNDGNRVGISVNSSPTNTSAPSTVINNIWQISEHYPLSLELLVNTAHTAAVASIPVNDEKIIVVNPVGAQMMMQFATGLIGKTITLTCTDMLGRIQMNTTFALSSETMKLPCPLTPGVYHLSFSTGDRVISQMNILKN